MVEALNYLIPVPLSVERATGVFYLTRATAILVEPANAELLAIARGLAHEFQKSTGQTWTVASCDGAPRAGSIYLTTVGADASLSEEGYQLVVDAQRVRLQAPQPAGLFRGLQTLRQLLPLTFESAAGSGPWPIAAVTIRDRPSFAWRGVMLDVARHFFPPVEVEKLIDLAAYFKLNTLHLHLSDDQGFRIAIDSWPELSRVGGRSAVGGGPGGFYTQSEYAALVAYAKARYITLVPEIDVPGHCNAALASYAELNLSGIASPPRTDTLVGYSSLCVAHDATYAFVADVLREVAALTPGRYVHLGGDEAKATSAADFDAFFEKALPSLQAVGKRLIGWDALGQLRQVPPHTVVQYWISDDNARRALSLNAKILMSPASKAYLDMKYDSATTLGQSWAGYISEQVAYEWDPAELVAGIGESDLVGVEAPLWTETLETLADLEYMAFPRLIGHAEIAWSPASARGWDEYKLRLAAFGPRLRAWGVNFYESSAVPWQ